jgi:hypothetical protein
MLPADEPESVTLPDGTTQVLDPADRNAFSIFEDICLLDNGEHPQFPQLEYLHKTFALELIESVRAYYSQTTTNQLFRKVCLILTHPKPVYQQLFSNYSCSQHSRSYSYYNTAAPLPPAHQSTLRVLRLPASDPRPPCCLSLAQPVLLPARDGGRAHPHSTHQTH